MMVAAALAAAIAAGGQAATPDAKESDRQEVMAPIAAFEDTWNRHDMRAHAALFHEDGTWIAWTGAVLQGRSAYDAELTRLHETVFKKSVHQGRIEELTFVASDVAIVRGYGTVVGNEPTPEKVERYRNLVVVTPARRPLEGELGPEDALIAEHARSRRGEGGPSVGAEAGGVSERAAISGIAPLFIVKSVPSALAFSRDRLGFDVTFQGPEPDDIFFGIVERGAAMIMLKDVGVEPVPNCTRDVKKGIARWDAYL
jgi:uncharacterized protein (TIGR02246 family)